MELDGDLDRNLARDFSRKFKVIACATVAFFAATRTAGSAEITAIDFNGRENPNVFSIKTSGPVEVTRKDITEDRQILLTLKGATLPKRLARPLDTSSFPSRIKFISSYPINEGSDRGVRVVVQLSEMVDADLASGPDGLTLKVASDGISSSAAAPSDGVVAAPSTGAAAEASAGVTPVVTASATAESNPLPPEPSSNTSSRAERAPNPSDDVALETKGTISTDGGNLDQFVQSQRTRRFTGRPVSLKVRDADLVDVFKLIAEASGFNIVIGDDVTGKISLSLSSVPWDQALDVILHTKQLGAERYNNLLRIVTLQTLTKEKQEEAAAKAASELNAPRVTRIFPINYAELNEMVTTISKFTSLPLGGSSASGTSATSQGSLPIVQGDARTNTIVVRDTPEYLDRIRKVIEVLDVQTPQVLIEAKIIETTESYGRTLDGSLGIGYQTDSSLNATQVFASSNGGNPLDQLIGAAGVFASGSVIGALSKTTSTSGASLGWGGKLSFIPGVRVNSVLSLAENEGMVKVISSPRVVVLNRDSATITQSEPIVILGPPTSTQNGALPTLQTSSALLNMQVTPTVTNEGSVLMKLSLKRDVPQTLSIGTQGAAQRSVETRALVESGTTLVIGGIYGTRENTTEAGVPWLRKIPLIGALFGRSGKDTAKSELFFFITPRILNPREAGISG